MSSIKIKAQEERDLYVLKQKAIQYYNEIGVPQQMEEILNKTFYDCPDDVYGHIANYFEKFIVTPRVTKIVGREVFDSNGQTCLQAEVYCMVKNFEKLLATTTGLSQPYKSDPNTLKAEERSALEEERTKYLKDVLNMLSHTTNHILNGADPTLQQEADSKLTEIITKLRQEEEEKLAKEREENAVEEPTSPKPESVSPAKGKKSPKGAKGGGKGAKEVVIIPDEAPAIPICGCSALSIVSQAICETGASLKHIPLYQHIASLMQGDVPNSLRLPLPVATILCSGKHLPGKQNYVTEFMIVPKPEMPYNEAYKHINKIYLHCAQSLSAKTGAISRNTNELGALCPTYDKPEQGLDLLQEAITAQGLTPGEDFNIMLNLSGPEVFDYEKGKYEVIVGMQKSAEDMADYWGDILNRYPSVIGIIDPMRRAEKESWMRLCERVTERCYVLGDHVHHRPGKLVEEILPEWRTSGVVLNLTGQNTVTEIMQATEKMTEEGCQVAIGAPAGISGTFSVDLAVGLEARFVKLGAPMRERAALYTRLLQIEEQLAGAGCLTPAQPHSFSLIKPPTPPPEKEAAEVAVQSPGKDKKN